MFVLTKIDFVKTLNYQEFTLQKTESVLGLLPQPGKPGNGHCSSADEVFCIYK
jgi:hypothetical protein